MEVYKCKVKKKGQIFYRGSPNLFTTLASNSSISDNIGISIAILTEKCEHTGFFYVFEVTEDAEYEYYNEEVFHIIVKTQ